MNEENFNSTQSFLPLFERRLKDLSDNISRNYDLLKEYEKALSLEDEPKRIARYRNEIENIKKSAAVYEKEYKEIAGKISQVFSEVKGDVSELEIIKNRLDIILQRQSNIQQTLSEIHGEILSYYDESEKRIIGEITSRINRSQAENVKTILEAVDKNQITEPEINELVSSVQNILNWAEKTDNRFLPEQEKLNKAVNSQISSKNKFKLVVPIVPTILSFETELELPVSAAVKKLWDKLVVNFKGHKEIISILPQD